MHHLHKLLKFQFLLDVFFFQLFLQGESALEESADEDDELKEINGGIKWIVVRLFYSVRYH